MVTDKLTRTNRFGGAGNPKVISKALYQAVMLTPLLVFATQGLAEQGEDIAPKLGSTPVTNQAQASSPVQGEDTPIIPALERKQREAQEALAGSVEESELVWLAVRYPGAEHQHETLALKQEAKHPSDQGAVLILHDTQQHANWPGIVREVRSQLPFDGWFTLSVNLPWPVMTPAPERALNPKQQETFTLTPTAQKTLAIGSRQFRKKDNPESTMEAPSEPSNDPEIDNVDINLTANSGNQDPVTVYRERALIHVQAGIDKLKELGFQNIVMLAIGDAVELAVEYTQSKADDITRKGFALIMIDAPFDEVQSSNFGARIGDSFQAPILDIVDNSQLVAKSRARLRKISAETAKFVDYQYIKLPITRGLPVQKSVTKRIKDWLTIHAPGERKKS